MGPHTGLYLQIRTLAKDDCTKTRGKPPGSDEVRVAIYPGCPNNLYKRLYRTFLTTKLVRSHFAL